jgi:hypothetical protein
MMPSRDIAAIALAPAVAPALLFVCLSAQEQHPIPVETTFAAAAVLAGFVYAATLLVGLPLWVLFRAKGFSRWWQFLGAGAVLGVVFGAIVTAVSVALDMQSLTLGATWGLPVGAITGLMFWLMIRPSW